MTTSIAAIRIRISDQCDGLFAHRRQYANTVEDAHFLVYEQGIRSLISTLIQKPSALYL